MEKLPIDILLVMGAISAAVGLTLLGGVIFRQAFYNAPRGSLRRRIARELWIMGF